MKMEIRKEVKVEKVVGFKCDICKKPCNHTTGEDDAFEYAKLHGNWGYSSSKDQQDHECHMCEDCYDKVKEFIESLGGQVRVRYYDLVTGHLITKE